jgi:hypothetical protein
MVQHMSKGNEKLTESWLNPSDTIALRGWISPVIYQGFNF